MCEAPLRGAVKDRAGRFETAEGGTIFLDEVGEIPLDIQNKLLRILHEKRYERIGNDRTRRADVRVVAATNRDLKKEAATGRFREDLYYRLNVFPLEVPPLRERMDDIPSLAKHFVDLSSRELKCAKPRLTHAAVTKLRSYDWPGNVRELRNVIERAVILARGGMLEFDLPMTAQAAPGDRPTAPGSAAPAKFLTEVEIQRFATTSCAGWKQLIGKSADPMGSRNFWASSPPLCFQGWTSGVSKSPNAAHRDSSYSVHFDGVPVCANSS
jgi:transcriptional regulator with GAF, ATPase, and Fis domain